MTHGRRNLDDLADDIRDHIDRETQDNVDRGMTPDDARQAALRAFGNVTRTMEDTRAVWVPVWLDQLLQDARYGLRMLRRNPAFSAVVILTLAEIYVTPTSKQRSSPSSSPTTSTQIHLV